MRIREAIALLLIVLGIVANLKLQEALALSAEPDWDLVELRKQ
jgi:hypothetical protein